MNIEVDTDELRNCEKILRSSSEKLNVEISYWEDQISELTAIWSGTEANSFYSKIENYINKLKALSSSNNSLVHLGEVSSYTLFGPPVRIIPFGFISFILSSGILYG